VAQRIRLLHVFAKRVGFRGVGTVLGERKVGQRSRADEQAAHDQDAEDVAELAKSPVAEKRQQGEQNSAPLGIKTVPMISCAPLKILQ